ncbi:MAG: glycosyltransferase, partial [Candidatus Methanomethylophilaceae archaeon]|nr:glycosyltransferase [Candidatus Methanomethylophilaceae archaeon]
LDSLKEQMVEFPQTRVIVVDDGGEEDLSWVKEYPNTILHRKRNGGAASARNKGLDIADKLGTEYIAFLDSDDEIYSNYLPTIYGDMRDGYAWVSYDWKCDGRKEWAEQTTDPLMINCAAWAYCFRADIINSARFPEHMVLAEDQAWLHMVLRDDVKHKHSPVIFYNYLWRGNNNSVVHRYLRGELKEVREENKAVMLKNIFYISNINSIGGIETMLWNMARKYGPTHDITVLHKTGDKAQIDRLRQFVRVKKYRKGEKIRCEKVFCNLDVSVLSEIEADEYYQIIHADYKVYRINFHPHPDVNHYLGVSENTCKTFHEVSGQDIEQCYNPIVVEKPKNILHLLTASRMTWEKGRGRIEQLATQLDKAGIPFLWTIFTDDAGAIHHPSIVYVKPRLDITDYIADADYLVQLSDTEGWSYAIYEALCLGTPVIVTDFPSAHEMGIENGKNGFILPMDMQNVPIEDIYKGVKKFKYAPKEDPWGDILDEGASDYEAEMSRNVK